MQPKLLPLSPTVSAPPFMKDGTVISSLNIISNIILISFLIFLSIFRLSIFVRFDPNIDIDLFWFLDLKLLASAQNIEDLKKLKIP